MAKRGRPRLYNSISEKMKAYRDSKKQGGAVRIGCYLPLEYKELLSQFCKENSMTMCDAICYLLDSQYAGHTPPTEPTVGMER